ncbi:MAG: hypothetical protein ABFD82_18345 [Syntrophaceae bacterium]
MKAIKVENCGGCPWSYEELAGDGTTAIDRCMGTDQIVEKEGIPDWCPLEDIIPVCEHFDKPYCFLCKMPS